MPLSRYHVPSASSSHNGSVPPAPVVYRSLARRFEYARSFYSSPIFTASSQIKIQKCLPPNLTQFTQLFVSESLSAAHFQRILTHAYHDALRAALIQRTTNTRAKANLLSLSVTHATRFFQLDLRNPDHHVASQVFNSTVRSMLDLQPSAAVAASPNATCLCGFRLSFDPSHLLTCVQFRNRAGADRHKWIQTTLATLAERAGYGVEKEHLFRDQRRADVSIMDPSTGKLCHVDVSVVCPQADTYRDGAAHTKMYAASIRDAVKTKKYADVCRAENAFFLPFVLETTGAVTPAVHRLVSRIADQSVITNQRDPILKKDMLDLIVLALAKGNAAIMHQGLTHAKGLCR